MDSLYTGLSKKVWILFKFGFFFKSKSLDLVRHTYASKLFKEKVDIKIICELLGHKDVSTTYDIYVHFIDNIVEDSVEILNASLPEKLSEKNLR